MLYSVIMTILVFAILHYLMHKHSEIFFTVVVYGIYLAALLVVLGIIALLSPKLAGFIALLIGWSFISSNWGKKSEDK